MNNTMPTWPGWETVRLIGRGSFGAVYVIERDMLGEKEKAALKVITIPENSNEIEELRDEGYDEASITDTFKEHLKSIVSEYALMRKLNGNTNVVNCDDVRYVQHDDGIGWDIFIKMELLTPMKKVLSKTVTDEQVIRVGADICRALDLCKNYSIIHRDIKPDNIFVSDTGDYKLGDFGIAKTIEKTSGGTKIGTYEYMAPEVYRGLPYGSAADIYSLGMVLYWLLNERRAPFLPLPPALPTMTEKETSRLRRFNGDPLPPPAHGSEELKRIVLKACAYDPKDRYQSAEEMLLDLEALSGKGAVPAPEPPAARPMMPAPEDTVNAGDEEAKRPILPATQSEEHDEDGAETVGLFGGVTPRQSAPLPERQDDDTTVGAFGSGAKQPDTETEPKIQEEVSTEDEEQTVGAFKLEKDPPSPQPQPKPVSKPKRRLWPILAATVVVVVGVIVLAQTGMFGQSAITTTKDNVTYSLANETLTISGRGGAVYPAEAISSWATTKENIRRIVIEEGVTSIGDFAFSGCNSLTSVSIPVSVTSIGSYAFSGCSSLTSVSIPNGVTSIESCTFYGCNSLTSVSIPASVTSIGNSAFYGCSSLTNVKIPDSVTSIGNSAFYYCSSLTSVSIPASVTSIGYSAFYYCSSLTSVSIPASVTSIGYSAFYDCRSLTNVSIPASVTSIGEWAFSGCSSLNHIYYGGTEAQWNAIVVGGGNNPLSSATVHYNSQ